MIRQTLKNLALFLLASPAIAQESFTVGYFNEWPLPAHYGRQTGAFDEALGTQVRWQAFTNSQDLISALSSGQIQVGLSVGITPIVVARAQGIDVQIIDIAATYPEMENCVTRPRLNITAENISQIRDIEIALPVGTSVHFSLLKFLEERGVDTARLKLVNLSPREAAAAFLSGSVDAACSWGAALSSLLERGSPIIDTASTARNHVFDATIVEGFYGQANFEQVVVFLSIINEINEDFATYPDPILPYLPNLVNLTAESTGSILNLIEIPSLETKLDETIMGANLEGHIQELIAFYREQSTLGTSGNDTKPLINIRYLSAVEQRRDDAAAALLEPSTDEDAETDAPELEE